MRESNVCRFLHGGRKVKITERKRIANELDKEMKFKVSFSSYLIVFLFRVFQCVLVVNDEF